MFDIRQRGSSVSREIIGGITTFMAMSYIIFVQVGLLGNGAGMDSQGVLMAVCLASAVACVLMGLWANYPVALAPGMGENFFLVYTVMPAMAAMGTGGVPWQMAMAMVVIAGVVFLALSLVGFRSRVLNAIPDSLKSGIAAGIGLFIAVIGFRYGNLVEAGDALIKFPGLQNNPAAWVALAGLGVTLALMAFRVHGAVLIGILAGTGVSLLLGKTHWQPPVAMPRGLMETAGGFVPGFASLAAGLASHWLEILMYVFILLFMDLFDTVGTLVGVSQRAGLMQNGKLPRASQALAADAAGTTVGGCLGSTTVTSFIESITGVQSGARTGLAAIVTGACMVAAMLFSPLVHVVMGDFGQGLFPTLAPALIVVGAMMLRAIRNIDWDDVTEYLPAFLTAVAMPLSYSIADGIALGFISYAFGKIVTDRFRQCPLTVYIFAVLFVVRYTLMP